MRRILAVLLLCVPLVAQEPKSAPAENTNPTAKERVLVELKYADPNSVANLLRVFNDVSIFPNQEMRAITLAGPRDAVDAAQAMIRQVDVAPKDIELTVHYLLGAEGENTLGTPPPKDLEPVINQLKNAFAFQNFRLLGGLDLRTRTGQRASTNSNLGEIKLGSGSATIFASFQIRSASVAPDGSTVRLDGMNNALRWPYLSGSGIGYSDLSLNTDVDIKAGQKVVVGRIGISHDQALFLALTAKVVN